MKRAVRIGLMLAAIFAAGTGGYWAGHGDGVPLFMERLADIGRHAVPGQMSSQEIKTAPESSETILYYKDPDGKEVYSATPRKTADGRAFVPVHVGEDASFDDKPVPKPASSTEAKGTRAILYYRNPMGLADTSPVPKKDSMGMDYIPVYAREDEDDGLIMLSPGKVQRTGVRSEQASDRLIVRHVRAPGVIAADERRISVVSVPADSFVSKVENVTTGEHVRKGEPLLQLYSPDIAAAAAQLLVNPGYEGTRRRLQNLNVPGEVIAEIEKAHQVPLAFTWPVPRDGVIIERNAVEGKKMAAGDVLFRIADLSTVWVLADVPEYELSGIRPGQPATIGVRSMPDRKFEGRVQLLYPQVSLETRTVKVRIEIANPEEVLLPGMYAEVDISNGSQAPVVSVPTNAVIDTGKQRVVILDKGEGRFEPRQVETGLEGDGLVEIRKGIVSGDRVVTSANFLIDAESNLKSALGGMTAMEMKP